MAILTIRNVDDAVKRRLRIQAAEYGCSMEKELRNILTRSLESDTRSGKSFAEVMRDRFGDLERVELALPERGPRREPPDFSSSEFDQ